MPEACGCSWTPGQLTRGERGFLRPEARPSRILRPGAGACERADLVTHSPSRVLGLGWPLQVDGLRPWPEAERATSPGTQHGELVRVESGQATSPLIS